MSLDPTGANGRLLSGLSPALAELEGELIAERFKASPMSIRVHGRSGEQPFEVIAVKLCHAQAAIGPSKTKAGALCAELGATHPTLYGHVASVSRLRPDGEKLLEGLNTRPVMSLRCPALAVRRAIFGR